MFALCAFFKQRFVYARRSNQTEHSEQLFIIGNGFDLHHGIRSQYSNFASYLELHDLNTFNIAEDYGVPEKDLWNSLEERFAEVDVDQIEDVASDFLASYAAEDWSDSYHHDYEFEIEQICHAISTKMRQNFADWVRQIKVPNWTSTPVQCIDRKAFYLNFNYTDTLQRVYGVPGSQVLHIHGSASDPTDKIILGHGWSRDASDARSRFADENTDTRVAGGFQLIDDLLTRTFKPSAQIIARNEDFFGSLGTIDEVFVLGHSLAAVDQLYFESVLHSVRDDAKWIVSYHDNKEGTKMKALNMGVPPSHLTLALLRNL